MSARANVVKYLKARQGARGLDQEQIHGLHAGDEEREATLLVSDLWALTTDSRRLEAAQRMADALRKATQVLFVHGSGWKAYISEEERAQARAALAEWEKQQ